MRRDARQIGIPDYRALGLVELIFGGWSEREGRMRIWSFASYGRITRRTLIAAPSITACCRSRSRRPATCRALTA